MIRYEKTKGFDRFDDVFRDRLPDKVVNVEVDQQNFLFSCENKAALKVVVYNEKIVRFRYTYNGQFERDFSYVLAKDFQIESTKIDTRETSSEYAIITKAIQIFVSKSDLRVKILDKDNHLILEDAKPYRARTTIHKGLIEVNISKKAAKDEYYFGLGDKSGNLNLRGQQLQNWNTDAFGFSKESDPLYRTVPFYYGVKEGHAYGIFFHNTYRSHFDFDSEVEGYTSFWAEGGEMDYFFMYGPELMAVSQSYHQITGTPELPPMWALGYHQCRWSYFPENRVLELAEQFREKQIPCDAIYLDIDYMDAYRCFTWDKAYFPRPKWMIERLKDAGFQTIVMIDPGIKAEEGYSIYDEGIEKDMFCKRTNGDLMIGPVWPEECVFPDYTHPKVRDWWKGLYKELYQEQGVSGFWNDMNEPAVFKVNSYTFPDEIMHDMDGEPNTHPRAHNIYGHQMSRSTYEGLKELSPEKRPFVLTRASFSGGQQYAAVWTGDNLATWEHLRLANIQCQRLSISGYSFVGTDIGGFAGEPEPELYLRWVQLGIFHPLFRTHSMGNHASGASLVDAEAIKLAEAFNRMDQEPWSFGDEITDSVRKAIELRYQLLPYLYTAFWQNISHGLPILRSLSFEDQSDKICLERENEFLFGDHIVVSPVLEEGQKGQLLYLPKGEWYHYYTKEQREGGKMGAVSLEMGYIPFYVRAGAVLPLFPVQQFVGEKIIEKMTLKVYAGEAESTLYLDNGEGYAYEKGQFSLRKYRVGSGQIHQTIEGRYSGDLKSFELEWIGLKEQPEQLLIDGSSFNFEYKNGVLIAEIPASFSDINLL